MRTRARPVVVVGLAATVGPLTLAFPAQAAFPGKNGRIAFTVQPRYRGEAALRRSRPSCPAGRGRRVLGRARRETASRPSRAWSPDGGGWRSASRDGSRARDRPRVTGPVCACCAQLTGPYGRARLGAERTAPAISRRGRPLHCADRRHGPSPGHLEAAGLRLRVVAARRHSLRRRRRPLTSRTMADDGIYTVRPDGSRLPGLVRDSYNASAPASPGLVASTAATSRSPSPTASTARSTWPMRPAERTGGLTTRRRQRAGLVARWRGSSASIRSGDLYVMRSDGSRRAADPR